VSLGDTLVVRPKGVKHPISVHSVLGIQGKYSLQIPQSEDDWRSLSRPLPVQYSVLHEKDISQTAYLGQIAAIAASKAKLFIQPESYPSSLKPLGNLRLNILSPEGGTPSEDIYAKLIACDDSTFIWIVHFTALPPSLSPLLLPEAPPSGDSRLSAEER
jgi:adenylate cyclase